jgi:hypothetical protein
MRTLNIARLGLNDTQFRARIATAGFYRCCGLRLASRERRNHLMGRWRRTLAVLIGTGAVAAVFLVVGAGPAAADYGPGALYQVEISANNVGGVPGDGVWLWIALYPDGTGDYAGSDCIHTGSLGGPPNHGYHERGDVSWTDSGGNLIITGVALVGGVFPVTITVPDSYQHSVLPSDSVITGFALGTIGGWAQVQVAP